MNSEIDSDVLQIARLKFLMLRCRCCRPIPKLKDAIKGILYLINGRLEVYFVLRLDIKILLQSTHNLFESLGGVQVSQIDPPADDIANASGKVHTIITGKIIILLATFE